MQTGDMNNGGADYSNKQQAPAAVVGGAAARRLAASFNNSSRSLLSAGNDDPADVIASKFGNSVKLQQADEPVNFFPVDSSSVSSPLTPNNTPLRYTSNSNNNTSRSKAPTKLLGGSRRARRPKSNSKTATGSSRNLLGDAIPEGEELSVMEEKMPPSNDQNTVYLDNSTMGATAKVKYTLKSVDRTLNSKDKRPSSNKNHTTTRTTSPGKQQHGRSSETRRGPYGKTLSFSNLGQTDDYPPPVAATAAAPVMDSNPLWIDEDGFIISGGPMPSFSTSTGSNTSSGMGASTDRVFGGFVPTHLVTSTTSSSIGKQPQPHRGSYSSERKPAARRTTSNNPRDKKLDQMEEATLQRIDTLRQLVSQDNDDDTASHLESQLDFVEDER
jgi:hypothetical protein